MAAPMSGFDRDAMRRRVQQDVAGILSRKKKDLKPEDAREGRSLAADLGIDSLDILQLVAKYEKEFRLKIPEEDIRGMDDIRRVLDSLERHWPKA